MISLKFKDFLKDRTSYIFVYFLGNFFTALVMYLNIIIDKKTFHIENIFYAFFLTTAIFVIFIILDFYKVNSFYKELKRLYDSDEKSIIDNMISLGDSKTSEEELVKKVLLKIHNAMDKKVNNYEARHKKYICFINNWVHNMKTPASVINLTIQDYKEIRYEDVLKSIWEENEKILRGLDIMLYNARLSEFNHDFNVESLDIRKLVQNVIMNNKKLFILNHVFPRIIGKNAEVKSDKKWIEFVINQIVVNAIKYTAKSEKNDKTVLFNVNEKDDRVILSINDNGIGIPKEDLKRVFDAFFTGKNGRKSSESTGMGMYLSKKICSELGHDLEVKSIEGQGTEFYITFYKGKNIFQPISR